MANPNQISARKKIQTHYVHLFYSIIGKWNIFPSCRFIFCWIVGQPFQRNSTEKPRIFNRKPLNISSYAENFSDRSQEKSCCSKLYWGIYPGNFTIKCRISVKSQYFDRSTVSHWELVFVAGACKIWILMRKNSYIGISGWFISAACAYHKKRSIANNFRRKSIYIQKHFLLIIFTIPWIWLKFVCT